MARARNIKPGFWKNEDLAECTITARLLFVGLWMLADREGRLEDRPKRIKAELFAFDTFEVDPLLVELERFGFIQRYAINGSRYIQVTKFAEHQTPHYTEKASAIPAPLQEEASTKGAPLQELDPHQELANLECAEHEEAQLQELRRLDAGMKRGPLPPDSLNPDSLNPDSRATAVSAGAREGPEDPDDPPEANGVAPTRAGFVCRAMRRAGLSQTNPGDPRLAALLEAGAGVAEFVSAAQEAVAAKPPKGWAWVLAVVRNRRNEAAEIGRDPAPPEDPLAWRKTFDGVQRRAAELGLSPRPGEMLPDFERRVLTAHQRAAGRQGAAA